MTFSIAIGHSDISFEAETGDTVLDAAERAGYALPYSCRKGVCSSCEAGLRLGTVTVRSQTLTGPQPGVLLCQAKATSDIVIHPHRIGRKITSTRKMITARVFRLERPTPDVTTMLLRFPVSIRARFKAGQYLRIMLPGDDTRNFSMANAPQESDGVRLHIRHVPGGVFSEHILAKMKLGDLVNIEIPYGEFYLRDDPPTPIIFIATGTGFAPIKAMIEDLILRNNQRPAILYWGGRRASDLYMVHLANRWQQEMPWFTFVPVLSHPEPEWQGRTGLVHEAVAEDHADLAAHQVYACGNPLMVRKARESLVATRNLPDNEFYSDPFVPSGNEPRLGAA